ncbi:hypothetical protein K457DRAFT_138724 [Linnemannia elongata AG-77]|uniref:Uncharacterized protein n=1 Tax=Linnemannia elongata AG-77 TaxID=1314771 RepID=A0A197JWI7_9FUNG|nr:hypothetical protein K457DRAFT_138724 [Linnemannia elongata AG-77]
MTAGLRLSSSTNNYSGLVSGSNNSNIIIINTNNSNSARSKHDDEGLSRQVEVMMTEATEDNEPYTPRQLSEEREERIEKTTGTIMDAAAQETERWDDAFELDAHQSLDQIFELLQRHCPQSPLSDSSDQSDYFQARPPPPPASLPTMPTTTLPLPLPRPPFPLSQPFTTHTTTTSSLPPVFPGPIHVTTTTNHALWNLHKKEHLHHQKTKRHYGSTRSHEKVDPQSCSPSSPSTHLKHTTNNNSVEVLPKDIGQSLSSSFRKRHDGQSHCCATKTPTTTTAPTTPTAEDPKISSFSPASSASSSPRAITASVTAPSTIATSTGSLLSKYKSADGSGHGGGGDKDSPTLSAKSMTTITQEMMLSNLPAYTGIITRINPIKRVKAWVDDLEDLEVPEEDLNFNHVRSILAKSVSMPETLESIDSWDTDSERSLTTSDRVGAAEVGVEGQPVSPIPKSGTPHELRYQSAGASSPSKGGTDGDNVETTTGGQYGESEKIETLDDAFEIPDDFGSFRLRMSPCLQTRSGPQETVSYRQQLALLQWRDSGSDFDEFDIRTPLDSHSLSSSESISRESVADDDDNLLDGIEFPAAMEDLRLVTHRQYKVEMEPSIFGKESRLQEDQDDFWDGLEIDDDDAFNHKGRNKNLVVRPVIAGRERSSSRVLREVVPLKDFVALPSRIPRLCRGPTDTSRPVTPAASLSRAHSTHIELPLRHISSKSSLPRLKRNSISRKEGTRIGSALPTTGQTSLYNDSIYASTPQVPSAPSALSSSRRNSALVNKDDLPSFKASTLAMRSVSFIEPSQPEPEDLTKAAALPVTAEDAAVAPKPPLSINAGRPFSSLRTLVRRLDITRPRFSIRGQIPAFDATIAVPPESSVAQDSKAPELEPIEQTTPLTDDFNENLYHHNYLQPRPSLSRSSSFTDWGSVVNSTETTKESRSPSRIGAFSLGEISEGGSTTSDLGEMAATSPVAAGEKFSRRWFLKRSPKQSMLSDGSELDRIDNLPTFGSGEQQLHQQQLQNQQLLDKDRLQAMQMAAAVAAAQGRRQSLDRVSAWLRKPQSMVNLKESSKPEVRRAESDVSTTKVQKTKSIRKSLFDIFSQTIAPVEEPKVELAEKEKEPSAKGQKLKKKKAFSGPTLIRDLSQTKVRKVSGMVFHPDSKMWNGNDHILNEFDDDEEEDTDNGSSPRQQHTPLTPTAAAFECPSPSSPYSQQYFSLSAYSPTAIIRPALISNMNQYSKQRTQVAGKMIFDPNRMCWIINPEYLTRKRQKKHGDQHHLHPRQPSLDDTWGDEPDVFAGMSDSDGDHDEDEDEKEMEILDGVPPTAPTATALAGATVASVSANSSLERSKGRRLISRPSFRKMSSQEYLADEERLQAWAEPMRPLPMDAAGNGSGGVDSRPNSMGVHSIVSKSSRRSLNMTGGCANGLFAGGGYSSRGEFEVGVEFDITDDFLEQCMATESQHRKDAGKFFALPCSPAEPVRSSSRDRTPQRMPSKVFNKLRRSSHSNGQGNKDKNKEKKQKDDCQHGKEVVSADIPPAFLDNKKETSLSPSAPLPLLSWPRRTKSKSVVLQAPILDCIGLPPPPGTLKPLVFQPEKKPHTTVPNKFKSLTLGRAGLFSHTSASTPAASTLFSRVHTGNKGKETIPLTDPSTAVPSQSRKSSRDMFFSQRLTSKKPHTPAASDRATLTFAATFAIARKGSSTAYDRRRISAHTFDPLTNTSPVLGGSVISNGSGSASNSDEWGFKKDSRFFALDIDSGIDSDEAAEDGDDCERGYRKMPNSRGRPPRRSRSQLIMEFAQHSGPGYRF